MSLSNLHVKDVIHSFPVCASGYQCSLFVFPWELKTQTGLNRNFSYNNREQCLILCFLWYFACEG